MSPQQEPETEGDTGGSDELYEIWHKMYPSLTQAADRILSGFLWPTGTGW